MWSQVTIDEELGLVYLPVESPTGDYYGGHRPGNNLYGESLVCLDLQTGVKKWHYQIVHHPIWDFDLPAAPILADITVGGRAIKAVAAPTKQGILYVFDRVTGKPVWPIVEKPVEKGDVPGEWYSPTQPMPTKPAGVREERHVARRSDRLHAGAARAGGGDRVALQARTDLHAAGGQQGRRPARDARARPDERRLELAGRRVRSGDAHGLRRVVERGAVGARPRAADARIGRTWTGSAAARRPAAGGGGLAVQGLSIFKPPYGTISAINLDKRRHRVAGAARRDAGRGAQSRSAQGHEHSAHGTAGLHRRHARDEDARHRRRCAGHDAAGTRPRGAMLRAYDKATGARGRRRCCCPRRSSGSPMTYAVERTAVHRRRRERRTVFG